MRELSLNEVESVNGGIFINPGTVILVVRLAQLATKVAKSRSVQTGAATAGGILVGWFVE